MAKRMLIDAAHPEETRVVVLSGNRLEEFDFESSTKKQVKGNIYLAKVTRVEPSLQAAFVDYGGNRHGFLAFSEIHPDYYRIPVSDRSGRNGEAAKPSGRGAANGGDDSGVPLAAALPEPVPVPEAGSGEEDTSPEEERAPERPSDSEHAEPRYGEHAERHEEPDDHGHGEGAVLEQDERHHGVSLALLDQEEHDPRGRREHEQSEHLRRQQVVVARDRERDEHRHEGDGE